jgi:Tol biopolymer transport system component
LPAGDIEGVPSQDGRFFTFVDWNTGNVAVEDLTTGVRNQLTDEGSWEKPAEYPLWAAISPDGTKIAYTWYFEDDGRTELRVVGRDGSNPRTILGPEAGFYHETVSFLALSPKGEKLVVSVDDPDNGTTLTVIDLSSGVAEQLLKLEEPRSIRGHFDWLPDGRHVYYLKTEEKDATSLWRVDTQRGSSERLWQTDKRVGSAHIHPNGRQITFDEVTHETAVWVMEGFIPGSMVSK